MSDKIKVRWKKIIFSLSEDLLLIAFLGFSLILLAEGLIPGIATSHLPWRYLAIFLILCLTLTNFLGRKFNLVATPGKIKKTASLLAVLAFFLVFLGNFWKGSWISLFLAILGTISVVLAYRFWKEK
ncbi:MAG: hypothetical protein ACOYS2_02615 [Patescibacteria group bacterium]